MIGFPEDPSESQLARIQQLADGIATLVREITQKDQQRHDEMKILIQQYTAEIRACRDLIKSQYDLLETKERVVTALSERNSQLVMMIQKLVEKNQESC